MPESRIGSYPGIEKLFATQKVFHRGTDPCGPDLRSLSFGFGRLKSTISILTSPRLSLEHGIETRGNKSDALRTPLRPGPPLSQPRQPLLQSRMQRSSRIKRTFRLRIRPPSCPALLQNRARGHDRLDAPRAHHLGGRLHASILARLAEPAHPRP